MKEIEKAHCSLRDAGFKATLTAETGVNSIFYSHGDGRRATLSFPHPFDRGTFQYSFATYGTNWGSGITAERNQALLKILGTEKLAGEFAPSELEKVKTRLDDENPSDYQEILKAATTTPDALRQLNSSMTREEFDALWEKISKLRGVADYPKPTEPPKGYPREIRESLYDHWKNNQPLLVQAIYDHLESLPSEEAPKPIAEIIPPAAEEKKGAFAALASFIKRLSGR